MRGPATIRFSKVVDVGTGQLIAYSLVGSYGRPRMIWMDGRSHPSDLALHTWAGFSTGRWERNTLVVTTSHIKTGWLQRNGAPTSDLATMTEFFTRYDNHLMLVSFVHDPVFLSEPMVRTTTYEFSPTANANAWGNCGPAQIGDELPGRAQGEVPHYLPGERTHVDEFLKQTGIPAEGARGGSTTLYPEYAASLRSRAPADSAAIERVALEPPRGEIPRVNPPRVPTGDIRVVPVRGNVYLLEGAGANIVAQVGNDGILMVDSGAAMYSEKVLAAVRQLSDKPIRFILNTQRAPRPRRRQRGLGEGRQSSRAAGVWPLILRARAHRSSLTSPCCSRSARPPVNRRCCRSAPGPPTPSPAIEKRCSPTAKRFSCFISRMRHQRRHAGLLPPL